MRVMLASGSSHVQITGRKYMWLCVCRSGQDLEVREQVGFYLTLRQQGRKHSEAGQSSRSKKGLCPACSLACLFVGRNTLDLIRRLRGICPRKDLKGVLREWWANNGKESWIR